MHEVQLSLDPHGDPGVGDVQSLDRRGSGDDVAGPDSVGHLRDPVLRDEDARSIADSGLDGTQLLDQSGVLRELPVGLGMGRHEVDRLGVDDATEVRRDVAHDPHRVLVGDPLAEVMQAARVAID